MKYFLIAGEASGDLHAAHLMHELRTLDPAAEFRFCGGDLMAAEGGTMLFHYRDLAYMGFIDVALHLRTILRGMRTVRESIAAWRPDAVVLIDYPGFNLKMARFVHNERLCPVFYYIAPKLWAWKEHRIKQMKRYVDRTLCILPFEPAFFTGKHGMPVTYVGNPTVDEVTLYNKEHPAAAEAPHPAKPLVALLPGSRRSEVTANLSRMLAALRRLKAPVRAAVAMAPGLDDDFYKEVVAKSGMDVNGVDFLRGETYALLQRADAALVTSGTATLETALFGVPQVVCYHIRCGRFVNLLRRLFLKVKYISLVNLVAEREVVRELVADDMRPELIADELQTLLPGGAARENMLQGYAEMRQKLGEVGAARRAAEEIVSAKRA